MEEMNRRDFLRNIGSVAAAAGLQMLPAVDALAGARFTGKLEAEEMAAKVMKDWGITFENGCISAPAAELAGKQVCADANTVRMAAWWDPRAGQLTIASDNKDGQRDAIAFFKAEHPFEKPEDPLRMKFSKGLRQ